MSEEEKNILEEEVRRKLREAFGPSADNLAVRADRVGVAIGGNITGDVITGDVSKNGGSIPAEGDISGNFTSNKNGHSNHNINSFSSSLKFKIISALVILGLALLYVVIFTDAL